MVKSVSIILMIGSANLGKLLQRPQTCNMSCNCPVNGVYIGIEECFL